MWLIDKIFGKKRNSDYVDLEYCPHCNAILTLQKGFSNNLPYWVCKGCGEMLIGNDIDDDIIWRCDRCEALLNVQNGFSSDYGEWKCNECGFVNKFDESRVFESEDEYRSQSKEPHWGMSDEDVIKLTDYREIRRINERDDIWVVEDLNSGERFVKKILTTYASDIYRYLLDNPINGMPRLYGVYEGTNKLVIIEEYINGSTLADVISEGNLKTERAVNIAIRLCEILESLHSLKKPIIHRDIKPSNIIIDKDGAVWLIDINVAKWFKPDEVEDTRLLGTLYYAAPEQSGYGSTASSDKSDIYAVGILLNVMLTGKLPKEEKPDGDIRMIIEKCIAWEPEDRYSAGELIEALQRVIDVKEEL